MEIMATSNLEWSFFSDFHFPNNLWFLIIDKYILCVADALKQHVK